LIDLFEECMARRVDRWSHCWKARFSFFFN
jgi:hypothetical protein